MGSTDTGGAGPSPSGGAGPSPSGGAGPSLSGGAGGTSGTGGSPVGTGGENAAGGSTGGSGVEPPFDCTREVLDALADDYFAALGANDPSTLPLAEDAKFTENAEITDIGTTEFWMNAGDLKHSQRLLDTTACSVAAHAVVPEGGVDRPIALRIKVEEGELTEIETIVVRPGDYTAETSNPDRIIEIAASIGWNDEVPDEQRTTREEMASWMENYFRAFPGGVCDVAPGCRRLENGGGDYSCGGGASCAMAGPGQNVLVPRLTLVDEVRGIVVGLTMYDFIGPGHVDMHMAKFSGGQVHAVHAILGNTNGESGWE